MRTVDVDGLVAEDHAVRGIWQLVGALNLESFYGRIGSVEGAAGRPAHDPRLLASLWIYGYSTGVASAREISRRCQSDPAYQWLTGLNEVNYHSLSDFRVQYGAELQQLAAEVLGVLSATGLVALRRVMHDGTKVRARAGADSFRRERRLRTHLEAARAQIEELEREEASAELSQRQRAARQRAARARQDKLQRALAELKAIRQHSDKPAAECRASATDPEARIMKQADGGYRPSYNVQISTDAPSGVIVGIDVSQSTNDQGLLPEALDTIETTAGRLPEQMVVDGGFVTGETIKSLAAAGVELIGPVSEDKKKRSRDIDPDFVIEKFTYQPEQDVLICPAGKQLRHRGTEQRAGGVRHRYVAHPADCRACPFKARCCPGASQGRWVTRQVHDPAVVLFREQMHTEGARQIYKQRGAVAEFSNLWFKSKIGLRQFSVCGLSKVKIEALWATITYNIQLWLRLCWKPNELQTCRA